MHKSNRSGSAVAGVALITVLAVLTVLGLLAAAFTIFTTTDTMTSRTSVARVTADMMCAAGLNHALSALWADSVEQPAWDDPQENWRTTFMPVSHSADDAADIDGLPGLSPSESKEDGRWIYVTSANGKVTGRYAVQVEDECSKVNINAAAAIGTHGQNMGVGPFELLMSDGRGRGLPLSTAYCVNALKYRYGNDLAPGKRGEDDNLTESTYGYDEIDNDADGVVDELGEGIDEQEEYSSVRPVWDDRVFASVDELLDKCDTGGRVTSVAGRRMLRRYATIYGRSRDMYFDERTGAWRRQVNMNVAVRDQVSRLMNRANAEARFESSSKNVALTVANIIDYRDQNHVLTTAASEYGVEAVCFNEVLSYDGSWIRETDWTGWGFPTDADGEGHVLCYNVYYGADRSENYSAGFTVQNRFRIKSVSGASVTLDEPATAPRRLKEFLKCEAQTGGWPRDLWKDGTAHVGVMADQRRETNGFDCTVESSDSGGGRRLSLKLTPAQLSMLNVNARFTITLKNAWHHDGSMWTDKPRQSELYCFRMPNRYLGKKLHYQVINANHCFPADWGWARSKVRDMDMDGEGNRDSVTQESRSDDGTYRLQYLYKDGKAIQPNSDGYIPVLLTSSLR
ncbi:MAG: hypothetical protein NTV22_12375, partial [bacterium]|nr:hypothetical protein [bacterium]